MRPRPRVGPPTSQLLSMLPGLTGEIARSFTQVFDPAISISTTLMSTSMLAQGIADASWPNQKRCPLGCSTILIAPTVSGKSFVYHTLAEYIRKCVSERLKADTSLGSKQPAFFVEDATREAVIMHLLGWSVAALSTDEGEQITSLFRGSAGAMAKLADCNPLYHSRVSTGRAALEDYRFLIHAMMQPDVFEECKATLGIGKGSVGLINRCQVAVATSSPSQEAVAAFDLNADIKARYAVLVKARINRGIDLVLARGDRFVLRMTAAAERRFMDIAREATSIQHSPDFAHVIEYTSRHCERVLHAAGTLHVTENDAEGEIQLESVEVAHQLGLWSIDSYADLTSVKPKPTKIEVDAEQLDAELTLVAHRYGQHLPLAPLRRNVANIGLTRSQFDRALPVLAKTGKIELYTHEGKDMILVRLPHAPWLDFNKRY